MAALLGKQSLRGKRIVVTAGPTFEPIDPVRFIGNRSSGKMGFAIASAAQARGAEVDLVTGPVALKTPPGVTRHNVGTALEMQKALEECSRLPPHAIVMAAAVGDFRPSAVLDEKLKRSGDLELSLTANPDLIGNLSRSFTDQRPTIVGFALETGDDASVIARAQAKLKKKQVDLIVANAASDAFEGDTNRVHLVSRDAVVSHSTLPKTQVANLLLDWIETQWEK